MGERGRTASQTGQWLCQERLRAQENQAEKSPRCADQEALRKPPGTAENQAETGVLAGPPSWLGGGSLQPPYSRSPGTPSATNQVLPCPDNLGKRAWFVATEARNERHW